MHALLLAAFLSRTAIAHAVAAYIRAQHVAGLSIGVVRHGEPIVERGFGFAVLGPRTHADAHTIYRIGSLTKSFTAAAVLALQREGRLRLGDSAAQYVDRFPWQQDVTIGELLAQRTGIPDYSDTDLGRSTTYSPAQLVASVSMQPLAFAPGASFQYSNTNYVLLGMIVARAAGVPYESYLQTAVLAPAGLQHTVYGDQRGEARGYARDTLNLPVPRSSVSYAFSAAGLSSNVPDLLRWVQMLPPPYYGFLEADVYGYSAFYASGNVNGYSALALFAPHQHDAVVILTNADALDLMPLAKSIFAIIETPQPGTYAHGFLPAQNENPEITAQLRAYLERTLPSGSNITTLEFLSRETAGTETNDRYRVTLSDGTRIAVVVRYTSEKHIDGFTLRRQ